MDWRALVALLTLGQQASGFEDSSLLLQTVSHAQQNFANGREEPDILMEIEQEVDQLWKGKCQEWPSPRDSVGSEDDSDMLQNFKGAESASEPEGLREVMADMKKAVSRGELLKDSRKLAQKLEDAGYFTKRTKTRMEEIWQWDAQAKMSLLEHAEAINTLVDRLPKAWQIASDESFFKPFDEIEPQITSGNNSRALAAMMPHLPQMYKQVRRAVKYMEGGRKLGRHHPEHKHEGGHHQMETALETEMKAGLSMSRPKFSAEILGLVKVESEGHEGIEVLFGVEIAIVPFKKPPHSVEVAFGAEWPQKELKPMPEAFFGTLNYMYTRPGGSPEQEGEEETGFGPVFKAHLGGGVLNAEKGAGGYVQFAAEIKGLKEVEDLAVGAFLRLQMPLHEGLLLRLAPQFLQSTWKEAKPRHFGAKVDLFYELEEEEHEHEHGHED